MRTTIVAEHVNISLVKREFNNHDPLWYLYEHPMLFGVYDNEHDGLERYNFLLKIRGLQA